MIVHLYCPVDWIWDHLRDTHMGVSVRVFPEKSN